jgi:hexokinase
LRITDEQLLHLMHILEEEMSAGLSPITHKKASVKMFPTFVRNIPNGTEMGHVLALDLGGTNFRVLLIDLRGNAKIELTSKIFVIPQSIMIGDGKHVRYSLSL